MAAKSLSPRARLTLLALGAAAAAATAAAAAPAHHVVIRTPLYPIFAVSSYGSIWVGPHHGNVVYRIDPRRDRIVRRVRFGRTPCGTPAFGAGGIFVPDCLDEGAKTLEISAARNRVIRTFPGTSPVFAYHSLWLLNAAGTFVYRLDPMTGVRLAAIRTGLDDGAEGGAETLGTAGAGAVWLGDQAAKTLIRIDAAKNRVTALIPLPGAAAQASPRQGYAGGGPMAFMAGRVWFGNPAGIYEIDAATNSARLLPIRIGNLWAWGDIAVTRGAGSVWVRSAGGRVVRIDPATGRVLQRYRAAGGGGGIAVAYHSLWIANAGVDSVWRERIQG